MHTPQLPQAARSGRPASQRLSPSTAMHPLPCRLKPEAAVHPTALQAIFEGPLKRCTILPLLGLLALLSGCSLGNLAAPTTETASIGPIQGRVHGGQQPVAGAHVYLFATGTAATAGKDKATNSGNASVSLLNSAGSNVAFDGVNYYVTTGSDGSFSITGDYTCTSGSQLYLYALGGNPGAGTNSSAAFLAGLGACPAGGSTLSPNAFFWVNEVTTVATAYALAGYAADAVHISANLAPSNGPAAQLVATGVANAMANVNNLVNISNGVALTSTPGGNGSVPQAEINTLANILAACINGSDASPANCTTLFNAAQSDGTSGTIPTDTATAAINIAHNAGLNIAALYALQTGVAAPFAPNLSTQPNDFSLQLSFGGGGVASPHSIAIDGSGNVWAASTGQLVNWYSPLGVPLSDTGMPTTTGAEVNSLLVDLNGNVWTLDGNGHYAEFSSTGALLSPGGGYASSNTGASALTSDTSGFLWSANKTDASTFRVDPNNGSSVASYSAADSSLVAADTAGYIWFASNNQSLYKLNETGQVISIYSSLFGASSAIATDSQNTAYVSDPVAAKVVHVSSAGAIGLFSDTVGGAQSLAVDGANNIFAAAGQISVHNTSGTLLSGNNYKLPAGTVTTSIAIDGSGDLWAAANTENSGQPGSHIIELIGVAAPVLAPLSYATMHGTRLNVQNLGIGFNGDYNQFPFQDQFFAAANSYYQSIGLGSMPGSRYCHAYLSWDVAEQAVGSGPLTTEGSRSWFEAWLANAQGHCDRALVTFKYISGVTVNGTSYPATSDFENGMIAFFNTNWSYTGYTGVMDFTAWNEPNNAAGSGDGLTVIIPAETAADYYLALRKHCLPTSCSVAAGDFASNGNLGVDYVENCTNDLATPLCSTASYMDTYKHYIANDAPNYGFTTAFRPEIFAYHAWDDVNNYINSNNHCTDPKKCTIRAFFNSMSDFTWTSSELWDTEVGAGQNPQSNPSTLVQACTASFILDLTGTVSSRFTRLYYTRADESDGQYWSLFDSSNNPKPSFYVLADRNISYVPPAGSTCP
jgi:sugar lactone lactonase YvrE